MKFKPYEDRRYYNCGGYALNTLTWVNPAIPTRSCRKGEYSNVEDYRKIRAEMAHNLKVLFPKLREIKKVEDRKKGEWVVAFRAAKDDFHFMVKKFNGCWYDKRGASREINRHTEDEVFDRNWYKRYTGKIYLFAYIP